MATDDPRYRFEAYCLDQSIPIVGISGTVPSDPDFALYFDQSATQPQINQANQIAKAGSFPGGWTPQGVPDLQSFQQEIFGDKTLSASAKTQLLTLIPLFQANIGNPTLIQQFWSDLKSESLAWLDSKTIVTVESYASQYFVPLVAITAAPQPPAAISAKSPAKPQQKGKKS